MPEDPGTDVDGFVSDLSDASELADGVAMITPAVWVALAVVVSAVS